MQHPTKPKIKRLNAQTLKRRVSGEHAANICWAELLIKGFAGWMRVFD